MSQRYHCLPMTISVFIQDDGISSYAYGHYATPSWTKHVDYTGATVIDSELGAHVDDDDAWLYIPYDN